MTMTEQVPPLTVDEAMAKFQAIAAEVLAGSSARAPGAPQTFEQAEEGLFRFAQHILELACPDPRACTHHHCLRHRLCRHIGRVHAKRASRQSANPRRTPGAEAVRYAVWVYMNLGR